MKNKDRDVSKGLLGKNLGGEDLRRRGISSVRWTKRGCPPGRGQKFRGQTGMRN